MIAINWPLLQDDVAIPMAPSPTLIAAVTRYLARVEAERDEPEKPEDNRD